MVGNIIIFLLGLIVVILFFLMPASVISFTIGGIGALAMVDSVVNILRKLLNK